MMTGAPKQDEGEHYVLLGLPRSASSWFGGLIRDTAGIPYSHEFFSLYQHSHFDHSFGHEGRSEHIAVPSERLPRTKEAWTEFTGSTYRFTKEVFSAFKLPFFHEHATCLCIHRSRHITFPGSQSTHDWIGAYYKSAASNYDMQSQPVKRMLDVVKEMNANHIVKSLAGHTLAYYQLLNDAAKLNVPVIDVEKACTLPEEELKVYLSEALPGSLYSETLWRRVLETRVSKDWLEVRRQGYMESGLEASYERIVTGISMPELMRN